MIESDFKRKLVAEVNALRGGYARRVEDRFAVGVLDLIIKLPEHPLFFAEGKLIDGNMFGPTDRQWVEGEKIKAAGLTALLLGWRLGMMHVSPWTRNADRRKCVSGVDYIKTIREYFDGNPS